MAHHHRLVLAVLLALLPAGLACDDPPTQRAWSLEQVSAVTPTIQLDADLHPTEGVLRINTLTAITSEPTVRIVPQGQRRVLVVLEPPMLGMAATVDGVLVEPGGTRMVWFAPGSAQ